MFAAALSVGACAKKLMLAPALLVLKTNEPKPAVERAGLDRPLVDADDDVVVDAVVVHVDVDVVFVRRRVRPAVVRVHGEPDELVRRVERERLHADRPDVVDRLTGLLAVRETPRVEVRVARDRHRLRW